MQREQFWLNDIGVLFRNNNFFKLLPSNNSNFIDYLNIIARDSIYLEILFIICKKNKYWQMLPLLIIIITIVLYHICKVQLQNKYNIVHTNNYSADIFINNNVHTLLSNYDASQNSNNNNNDNDNEISGHNYEVFTYDADNQLVGNDKYKKLDQDLKKLEFDDYQNLKQGMCIRPNKINPFMNPLQKDFNEINYDHLFTCNSSNNKIEEMVDKNFNYGLFQNIDDLFDMKNGQRQFYTVPVNTVPNDSIKFANWCYRLPPTCKENQENCVLFEDIRFKR